jgi:ABC transporter substrate binding protein
LEIEGGVISSLMQQAIPAQAGGDYAMTSHSTIADQPQAETETAVHLFDNWFDPIEAALRDRAREFLQAMFEGELDEVLERSRYVRRPKRSSGGAEGTAGVIGHRHGHRSRTLLGTFGQVRIEVPRARLDTPVEGQNVAIEYRWANNQCDRLPELAADLVRRQVTVIAAIGSPSAPAAKVMTTTIPIVFLTGSNPVEVGIVTSLARPGGNLTGVTVLGVELGAKRLELLHELVPTPNIVAALINPNTPAAEIQSTELQTAARTLGLMSFGVQF